MSSFVLHGLIQKAQLDANRYCLKPASTWGWNVWLKRDDTGWQCIAQLPNEGAAQEYACERLARLVER